jgi:hypothetical protein
MPSKIEIINYGLSQVRVASIESLVETSPQAIHVNRIYDMARDATLSDVAPKWARKQAPLALLTEEVSGYDFVYAYPADCLRDIEIWNPAKVNQIDTLEYDLGISESGADKVILTNYEQAELIYTIKVTNTGVYDILFAEALAMKIAALSAVPLKGDDKLAQMAASTYLRAVSNAKVGTRNSGYKKPDESNSFRDARM